MNTNEHSRRAYQSPQIHVCQMEVDHLLQEASKTVTEGGGGGGPDMGENNSGSLVPAKENTGWLDWGEVTEN